MRAGEKNLDLVPSSFCNVTYDLMELIESALLDSVCIVVQRSNSSCHAVTKVLELQHTYQSISNVPRPALYPLRAFKFYV